MAKQDQLDQATLNLVRFAAAIAQGYEPELRERAQACKTAQVPPAWVDEMILQSVLMAGYPRALVAYGLWRKTTRLSAPPSDPDAEYGNLSDWTRRGEQTCEVVYGTNYTRLRQNVRELHFALDLWMITEGYGRTMSRPGLDLLRRELCIVAQTAVLEVPRQLHSHLRGALHAGGSFGQVEAVLSVVNPLLSYDQWKKVKELWTTVKEGWEPDE